MADNGKNHREQDAHIYPVYRQNYRRPIRLYV